MPIVATRTPELERRNEPFVRFVDPAAPERALDQMLDTPAEPDPRSIAARDWSRIARRVLELELGVDARDAD